MSGSIPRRNYPALEAIRRTEPAGSSGSAFSLPPLLAHPAVLLGFLKNLVRYLNREREQLAEIASQHFGGASFQIPEFDLLTLAECLENAFGDHSLIEGVDTGRVTAPHSSGDLADARNPGNSNTPATPDRPVLSSREQAYASISLMLPLRRMLEEKRTTEERLVEARLTKAVTVSTALYEKECRGLERQLNESAQLLQQARKEIDNERRQRAEEGEALRAMSREYEDLVRKHQLLQDDTMRLAHAVAMNGGSSSQRQDGGSSEPMPHEVVKQEGP